MGYLFAIVLSLLAVFLVLLVLVQRGRGGGLTGALGGVGGSSAFGAKAGDIFTKITIVAASIWIVICLGAAYWAGHRTDPLGSAAAPNASAPIGQEPINAAEEPADGTEVADVPAAEEGAPPQDGPEFPSANTESSAPVDTADQP